MSSPRRRVSMRRSIATALVLAAISVVLLPTAALADGTLDQSQPLFTNGAAGNCETEQLAQTFTSGLTGALDRVDLHLWRDESNTSADLHVQIETAPSAAPSGVVLATGSVPFANIGTRSGQPDFVSVTFDPPAKVTAGERYAIVVLESGLVCTQGYWWDFVDGIAYPLGQALARDTANWIPFGGDHGQDFAFKTYVDTTVPSVDIPHQNVRLRIDGIVPLTVFARCQPGQQAFELDVSLHQAGASGSTTLLGPGLIPCDAISHPVRVLVSPDTGTFVPGPIDVDAFLGVFDPIEGDLGITGTQTLELQAPPSCRVRNVQQGTWFATNEGGALSTAIFYAAPGDQLNVFGTCTGSFRIDRDLVVSGSHTKTNPTTISGGGFDRTLWIAPDVTVTLSRLTITGGNVPFIGGGAGLYVNDGAVVRLERSVVIANSTSIVGGGIVNGGSLTVFRSFIEQNHAVDNGDGGGIYNFGQLVVIHSRLWNNTAGGAGGGLFNEGSAVFDDSSIRFNRAGNAGGILNVSLLTLNNTVVTGNHPDNCEGC